MTGLFDAAPYDTSRRPAKFRQIPTGRNVLEETRLRFRWLWNNYRTVVVSWSTGKDSTVAAELAAETAPPDRRPVILYEDDELMPTGSLAVAEQMAARTDVELVWSTTPATYECHWLPDGRWQTWDTARRWHRPRPPQSVVWPDSPPTETDIQHRRRWQKTLPQPAVCVVGVRAVENPMRRMRLNLSHRQGNKPPWNFQMGHCWPLYDWLHGDIWKYIRDRNITYNAIYDRYAQAGIPPRDQRLGIIINHPGTLAAQMLPVVDPQLYAACLQLWPGFAGLIRYPEDNRLTGTGHLPDPPPGVSWLTRIRRVRASNPDQAAQAYIGQEIGRLIRQHRRLAPGDPILARTPHPRSGISWERLTRIAIRGELHIGPAPGRTLPHLSTRPQDWQQYKDATIREARR